MTRTKNKESSAPAKLPPPSPEFEDAFRGGLGGCTMECDCGRTLFDNSHQYDWEEGELERLEALAESDPEHYAVLDFGCSSVVIDGRTFVMGCPCNGLRAYENFIRNHAEQLAKFLVHLRQERLDYAEALKLADKLANFPPQPDPNRVVEPGYPIPSYPYP